MKGREEPMGTRTDDTQNGGGKRRNHEEAAATWAVHRRDRGLYIDEAAGDIFIQVGWDAG
jgi:hypothetical protein